MIAGTDLILETPRQSFDVGPILDAAFDVWPDGFFQDAEAEDHHPLITALVEQRARACREFFIYKDQASVDSWAKEGWTEQHANNMVHFLITEDAARPDILQLTLVIGSATSETVRLFAGVFDALSRMAAGESAAHIVAPHRLGSRPPSCRLHVGQGPSFTRRWKQ